jgi:hypothetical protein
MSMSNQEKAGPVDSMAAVDLGSCRPALQDMDWERLADCPFVFVGVGAVNRAVAEHLAYLGMRRCVAIDPKGYKTRSIASQCAPVEVGMPKAVVVAQRLRMLGVEATALVDDVYGVEPGYVKPGAVVIASADNRRADIGANRLAAQMRVRLIKANVEPQYLTASVRCYDLRSEDAAPCLECQMSAAQYADQRHPASCDGDEGRPTGSPRALCQVAAGAAALAAAQVVCSPQRWAKRWLGRQWHVNLLSGQADWSVLASNPNCRWDHGRHWQGLVRLGSGPGDAVLARLLPPGLDRDQVRLRFSAWVATRARCECCGRAARVFRWVRTLRDPVGICRCGGALVAVPFWTFSKMAARQVRGHWDCPLAVWGVPAKAVIAFEGPDGKQRSFVIGEDRRAPKIAREGNADEPKQDLGTP